MGLIKVYSGRPARFVEFCAIIGCCEPLDFVKNRLDFGSTSALWRLGDHILFAEINKQALDPDQVASAMKAVNEALISGGWKFGIWTAPHLFEVSDFPSPVNGRHPFGLDVLAIFGASRLVATVINAATGLHSKPICATQRALDKLEEALDRITKMVEGVSGFAVHRQPQSISNSIYLKEWKYFEECLDNNNLPHLGYSIVVDRVFNFNKLNVVGQSGQIVLNDNTRQ